MKESEKTKSTTATPFSKRLCVMDELYEDIGFVNGVIDLLSHHEDYTVAEPPQGSILYVLTEAWLKIQKLNETIRKIDGRIQAAYEKGYDI